MPLFVLTLHLSSLDISLFRNVTGSHWLLHGLHNSKCVHCLCLLHCRWNRNDSVNIVIWVHAIFANKTQKHVYNRFICLFLFVFISFSFLLFFSVTTSLLQKSFKLYWLFACVSVSISFSVNASAYYYHCMYSPIMSIIMSHKIAQSYEQTHWIAGRSQREHIYSLDKDEMNKQRKSRNQEWKRTHTHIYT